MPLDQWHLAQVLLQNSRLSPGIWKTVQEAELLSPMLLAMVAQAQSETGGPTAKELLEQEIVQRRLEMTEQINVLGHIYARDTIGIPTDSLKNLMSHDQDHQFLQKKVELLLAEKRYAEADALLNSSMAMHNGREVMADLLTMQQSTDGDWKTLDQADKDVLYGHAEAGKAGAARAAAILLSTDVDAPLPPVSFPNFTKSRAVAQGRTPAILEAEPTIACYPNPAKASTFVTYPSELDGSPLMIHDAKGAKVITNVLQGNGLFELDTRSLAEGLYHISIAGTPLTVKLTVQH